MFRNGEQFDNAGIEKLRVTHLNSKETSSYPLMNNIIDVLLSIC
jgi:hypothetical protein